jgi:hypothetical protein
MSATAIREDCECGCVERGRPHEVERRGAHRYRMRSTGYSSARFGPCEVCGEWASDVFLQNEEQLVRAKRDPYWTVSGCRSLFGHEGCLRAARRPT